MPEMVITDDYSWLDLRMVIEDVREKMIGQGANLRTATRNFEKEFIDVVLGKVNGDWKRASRILGVSQSHLRPELSMGRISHNSTKGG